MNLFGIMVGITGTQYCLHYHTGHVYYILAGMYYILILTMTLSLFRKFSIYLRQVYGARRQEGSELRTAVSSLLDAHTKGGALLDLSKKEPVP